MTNMNNDPNPTGMGGQKGTGLSTNIAGLLCYLLLPPFGSIAMVMLEEKSNLDVQFHGWQGIILGFIFWGGWIFIKVLKLIIGETLGGILWILFVLAVFSAGVVSAFKAYKGERWKIPLIGDFAAKKAGV